MAGIALHKMAAQADPHYVRYNDFTYELVHRNTGRVLASDGDVLMFSSILRRDHNLPMERVCWLIRNKKYGEYA